MCLDVCSMDPVNRRDAWKLIQDIKVGRAVILTTHNMVEADTLGDRIAVMAFGQVVAFGSALRLKRKFGTGYQLSLFSSVTRIPELLREVHAVEPSAVVSRRCVHNAHTDALVLL